MLIKLMLILGAICLLGLAIIIWGTIIKAVIDVIKARKATPKWCMPR